MKKIISFLLFSVLIAAGTGYSQSKTDASMKSPDTVFPKENAEISGNSLTVSGAFMQVKDKPALKGVFIAIDKPSDAKQAAGAGKWKITYDGLSAGKHILYIYSEDVTGARSAVKEMAVTINPSIADKSAPVVKFTLEGTNVRIPYDTFMLSGTADDGVVDASGIKEVKYSIDNGEWKSADGASVWEFKLEALENGDHTVQVKAIDGAGNEGAPVLLTIRIDVPQQWYRLISVAGMLVLLGIAFLMSNNRKAIKLKTVLWGVGLQLLFALIILGSGIISFIGMFIFTFMILFYIFEKDMQNIKLNPFLFALIILFGGAAAVTLFYFGETLGNLHITTYILIAVFVFYIVSLLAKKGVWARNAFVAVVILTVAVLWARGISGQQLMAFLSDKVSGFLSLTWKGTEFLLGEQLVDMMRKANMFVFLVNVIPTIIFFSAFMSMLYYLGIIQIVISAMGKFMMWNMGTSGAETLSCSANIFVGQTESPFLIKPFLADMTKSELNAVMIGGFATIAGGVLAAYIGLGVPAQHLIAASVMSAPAALVIAKIIHPETETSMTAGDAEMPDIKVGDNIVEAVTAGTTDGLKLAANVAAMLLSFIAILAFVDVLLGWGDKLFDGIIFGGKLGPDGGYAGIFPMSMKELFGFVFRPLAFVMGVPWEDSAAVGNMLGLKITINEFIAYITLGDHISANNMLAAGTLASGVQVISQKAVIISTYAFCGFANFSSIGIQIGGISALSPERRSDLASLGFKAMIGGALASWMTATIAGMLL
jgi:CNT family concentrative nucleoside transporter